MYENEQGWPEIDLCLAHLAGRSVLEEKPENHITSVTHALLVIFQGKPLKIYPEN